MSFIYVDASFKLNVIALHILLYYFANSIVKQFLIMENIVRLLFFHQNIVRKYKQNFKLFN
jgi:hypothetical protein